MSLQDSNTQYQQASGHRPLSRWVQQFVSDRLSNIVLRMVGLISLLFDVHVPKGEKNDDAIDRF
jgi:hypothetical protein